MGSDYSMTMEHAKEVMECYKEVFTKVRLLDTNDIQNCQQNNIYLRALEEKSQKTKLEFSGEKIYQVIARYVQIDEKPYVMELVKCLNDDFEMDYSSSEKLIGMLAEYDEKLYRDVLTGAYNRRYFEEYIKKTCSSSGVAVIDLDDFKLYNDTFGHDAGDAALRTVVKTVCECMEKHDMIIRYGGDEFLLILPDADENGFVKKLQRIQKKIHLVSVPGYPGLHLSVSIGGVISEKNESVETAVRRADRFMYQAKIHKGMIVTEKNAVECSGRACTAADLDKMKQQILIVDDSRINREILSEILEDDFRILEAENGRQCIDFIRQYGTGIKLILLDIVMPVMNGFEVLSLMSENHWIEDIPVIMISTEDADTYVRQAYELGVSDYISRPFNAKIVYQRVFNTIKLYAKQRRLISLITNQVKEKEKNDEIMISILSQIVGFRNGESASHVLHINKLTEMLLEQLMKSTDRYNISWSDKYLITTASALHDIGKIGIDEKIVNKPGRLTKEEFDIMKAHTLIGASILKKIKMYQDEPLVKTAYQICRWHHERYDGRGYPDGLKEDEIPISAQVVSLVDVYDALISKRVYKEAYPHEKAVKMILNGECGKFNPDIIKCFMEIQDKLKEKLEKL